MSEITNNTNQENGNSYTMRFFFATVILTAVILICGMCYLNSSFSSHQQKILSIRTAQLERIESMLSRFESCVTAPTNKTDSVAGEAILSLSYHLKALEHQDVEHDTTAMLDMEFAKIQHEYEVMALWAGILTIVFLIFSFYSLIKSDTLTRQSEDALSEIKIIKTKAEEKKTEIDGCVESSEKKLNERLDEIKRNAEEWRKALEVSIQAYNTALNSDKNAFETKLSTLSESLKQVRAEVEALIKTASVNITKYKESVSFEISEEKETLLVEIQSNVNDQINEIKSLAKQVLETIEMQLAKEPKSDNKHEDQSGKQPEQ